MTKYVKKYEPIPIDKLTDKEIAILIYVAQGHTNLQIAQCLYVSPRTIEKYINTIYFKLHARNRANALYLCFLRGYVSVQAIQQVGQGQTVQKAKKGG